MQQAFLMSERWWDAATHGIAWVDRHHQDVVAFAARQWLDMFSPGNLLATNPVVLKRTLEQGGTNRSAEHTSELQSLMRISYAVFCLKKTKQDRNHTIQHSIY